VIGTHAIHEVLRVRPRQVKGMWIRQGWESSGDLREMHDIAQANKVKIDVKPEGVLEKFGSSQQGAAVFVDGAPEFDMQKLAKHEKSMVLMLDGIEDPHNLGAIMRTSWLVGAHGVLIPEDRAVGLTPTVHKVACGGVEHVPVEETTNFSKYSEELKKQGYWIYGLSPRGERSIFELELPDKGVWAVGAEDKGLRVTTERLCDELAYIPQASSSASYNASVATAMALAETLRQHAARGIRKKS
jgi:23S rRNA (guanosine2251-2'-O)-methyltransferase